MMMVTSLQAGRKKWQYYKVNNDEWIELDLLGEVGRAPVQLRLQEELQQANTRAQEDGFEFEPNTSSQHNITTTRKSGI